MGIDCGLLAINFHIEFFFMFIVILLHLWELNCVMEGLRIFARVRVMSSHEETKSSILIWEWYGNWLCPVGNLHMKINCVVLALMAILICDISVD